MKLRVLAGLVAVAMLAGTSNAWAQGLGVGVKIGPSFSSVAGNPSTFGDHVKKDNRIGVTAGAFFTVAATELIAFQPEVLYQQAGTNWEDLDFADADGNKYRREVDHLEIPLLLRLGRSSEDRGFYFLVGPTLDFVVKAEQTQEATDTTTDIKDNLKSATVGLSIGIGMTWQKLLFEFRYTAGLTDSMKDPDPLDPDNKVKNRSSAILVGYKFK